MQIHYVQFVEYNGRGMEKDEVIMAQSQDGLVKTIQSLYYGEELGEDDYASLFADGEVECGNGMLMYDVYEIAL